MINLKRLSELHVARHENKVLRILKIHSRLTLHLISCYYPLDYKTLIKLESILNWESRDFEADFDGESGYIIDMVKGVSDNERIPWSIEILDAFKERINWAHLSRNPSLSLPSKILIETFFDNWDWIGLSDNKGLNISDEVLEYFQDSWHWKCDNFSAPIFSKFDGYRKIITGICGNRSNHWNESRIEKYRDRVDWGALSNNNNIDWYCVKKKYITTSELAPSSYILDKYERYWDFERLSYNTSLKKLFSNIDPYARGYFLNLEGWDWNGLSSGRSIYWTEELLANNIERLDWKSFSRNTDFDWSENFIAKYADKLDWSELSRNPSLPWSKTLLKRFFQLWDWNTLSENGSLPWTSTLIAKYKDRWNWEYLSRFSVQWNRMLLSKFKNRIVWDGISENSRIMWDLPLLKKYNYRIRIADIFLPFLEPSRIKKWNSKILSFFLKNFQDADYYKLTNTNKIYSEFLGPIIEKHFEELCEYFDDFMVRQKIEQEIRGDTAFNSQQQWPGDLA